MNVGKNQVWVIFKSIEHPVAMMRIDIHISDTLHVVVAAQIFGSNAAIVKHTETRSVIASGMMQAGNGDKCALVIAVHDFIDGAKNRSDNSGGRVVDSRNCRRVAIVQPTLASRRQARHFVDVISRVKKSQFVDQCGSRMSEIN